MNKLFKKNGFIPLEKKPWMKSWVNNSASIVGSKPSKNKTILTGFTLLESVTVVGIFVIIIVTVVNLYMIYSRANRQANQRQKILNEVSYLMERMAKEIRLDKVVFTGTFSYGLDGEVALYSVDGDAGIFGKEIELVLKEQDSGDQIAYYFWDGDEYNNPPIEYDPSNPKGLYQLIRDESGNLISCQKIFDLENIEMADAGFRIYPSNNPYPESDYDCRDRNDAIQKNFDGYYCECNDNPDCYSATAADGVCSADKCTPINVQPLVTIFIRVYDKIYNSYLTFQTTVSSRIYKR